MSGSSGSTRQTKPSPLPTMNHSSFIGPVFRSVRLGPLQEPLSCRPPMTRYGLRLSTQT